MERPGTSILGTSYSIHWYQINMKVRTKKTIKTVEWEEVVVWNCPRCKQENEEYGMSPIGNEKIKCRHCKRVSKLL